MGQQILTVGPRELPGDGWAEVWIDTGVGPGYTRRVSTDRLTLSAIDDGQGGNAIYVLALPADVAE